MTFTIFIDIILPIFILIGVGAIVDRAFHLDLNTLSKLNFYVFVPALVFVKTLDAKLSPALFGMVALFTLLHITLMFGISWCLFGAGHFRAERPVLSLASVLSNAGNYGIPLATLAFGAQGASAMAIVVLVQNLMTFTAGLWVMDGGRSHWRDMLIGFLKVPVVWAATAAIALLELKVQVPAPIHDPLAYLSDGLIPVALITLGVQLARSHLGAHLRTVSLVTAIRLLLAPLVATLMVVAWTAIAPGSLGALGPVMVIAAGMPVAVNVYILSVEYERNSDLASQMVFLTTLLSAVTLTGWLVLVKVS